MFTKKEKKLSIIITEVFTEDVDYQVNRNKPMPSHNHRYLQNKIGSRLDVKYEEQYNIYAELTLKLPDVKESVPDLAIYPYRQIDWENDQIKTNEPPITTVEILSPTQNINEILDKFASIYFPAGVKSAWLVIPPMKFIAVYTPDMNYVPFHNGLIEDRITGISIDLRKVFYL